MRHLLKVEATVNDPHSKWTKADGEGSSVRLGSVRVSLWQLPSCTGKQTGLDPGGGVTLRHPRAFM